MRQGALPDCFKSATWPSQRFLRTRHCSQNPLAIRAFWSPRVPRTATLPRNKKAIPRTRGPKEFPHNPAEQMPSDPIGPNPRKVKIKAIKQACIWFTPSIPSFLGGCQLHPGPNETWTVRENPVAMNILPPLCQSERDNLVGDKALRPAVTQGAGQSQFRHNRAGDCCIPATVAVATSSSTGLSIEDLV
jgi:hypothetical protein